MLIEFYSKTLRYSKVYWYKDAATSYRKELYL